MNKTLFTMAFLAIVGAAPVVLTLPDSHASTQPNRQKYIEPVFGNENPVPELVSQTTFGENLHKPGEFKVAVNLDQFCIKKNTVQGEGSKNKRHQKMYR